MSNMAHCSGTTCPLARWRERSEALVEYSIEGLSPCCAVSGGNKSSLYYGWQYVVTCPVAKRTFRSRLNSREACVNRAAEWLNVVHCPGHIFTRPNATAEHSL